MAFHDSAPSRVWKFGCRAPRGNAEAAEQQFWLAHRYYNNLIELEHKKRADADAATHKYAPDLAIYEQSIETILAELQQLRETISQRNQEARKRTGKDREREKIKALEQQLAEAKATARAERERLWGLPVERPKGEKKSRRRSDEPIRIERRGGNRKFLDEMERIDNACLHRQKQLRGGCNVFWGTYLLVERAWDQACKAAKPKLPRFRRWTGDGVIGVQMIGGLSVADALSGTNSCLRLIMQEGHCSARGQNGQVWLRIGSEAREPVWAIFDFRLHRPLPSDSVIKWAVISRRFLHRSPQPPHKPIYSYSLNLTLSSAERFATSYRSTSGTVAVNLGWRALASGSLRVATWIGDDGKQGFLNISYDDLRRWTKCDELRSIRDRIFDHVRARLVDFLEANPGIPDWLREASVHLQQWRSHERLWQLIGIGAPLQKKRREGEEEKRRWRENRFPGDEEIFDLLDGWIAQDMHLWRWEATNRCKAINWRKKLYEQLAVDLRRQYKMLRIAKINYRKLALRAKPEDRDEVTQTARFNRVIASSGLITDILKDSFGKEDVLEAKANLLTQRCPYCSCEERWDAAPSITHYCQQCKRLFDQDVGHCLNLLKWTPPASGEDMDEKPVPARWTEEPTAEGDNAKHGSSIGNVVVEDGEALAG